MIVFIENIFFRKSKKYYRLAPNVSNKRNENPSIESLK